MSHDILLSLIDADPNNARKTFDDAAIAELAASIVASGLAVPILLRPVGDRYIIVHGERRYRAVRSLGWPTIPADVRDIDAEAASWLGLVENVQRADLSPIDEAHAYQGRLAAGVTQSELGRRIGKTQSYVAQKIRLLKLPVHLQDHLASQTISEGHGRQLLRLKNESHQATLCTRVIAEHLPVSELSKMVDEVLSIEALSVSSPGDLDTVNLNVDGLYPHFTPTQFRQLIDSQFTDRDTLQILEAYYAFPYYRTKARELDARFDRVRTIPEAKSIAEEAGKIANTLAEYSIRAERRAGQIFTELESMSRDIPDDTPAKLLPGNK
jgi:ParB/RepB/Spo0J family partition protein